MFFPAKVLLFGEHTVLRGGRGLAIPYPRFSLSWTIGEVDDRLLDFARYLRLNFNSDQLDCESLIRALEAGARLSGNIPASYGLGSSGAVCAAVWHRFGSGPPAKYRTRDLRQILSRMESHFHGSSSGTDPLVSFLNKPLLLDEGGDAGAVSVHGAGPNVLEPALFLLDTGYTRQSGNFIGRFLNAFDGTEVGDPIRVANIGNLIRAQWMPAAESAIDAMISGENDELYRHFASISAFQLAHFPDFIPQACHQKFNGGDTYRLKLCGAGGGGMLLGLCQDVEKTKSLLGPGLLWL